MIKNNPQVYTTQEGIEEIKNNPQVYTTQEGKEEIKSNPLGIHPGIWPQVKERLKVTLRYTLPKGV